MVKPGSARRYYARMMGLPVKNLIVAGGLGRPPGFREVIEAAAKRVWGSGLVSIGTGPTRGLLKELSF